MGATVSKRVSDRACNGAFSRLAACLFCVFFVCVSAAAKAADGTDPNEAAKAAWQNGELFEYALAIEAAPQAVSEETIKTLRELETEWDAYFLARSLPSEILNRDAAIEALTRHCRARAGNPSCAPLRKTFLAVSDAELRDLYAASLVIDFARERGLSPEVGAGVTDLLLRKKFNCASVSTMALHLLQRVGVMGFNALQLPDHVTLVTRLSLGVEVYLNNAQEFLPRSFFENPMSVTGYPKIGGEKPVFPGAILASTWVRSGKLNFAKGRVAAALENWKAALKIDPACPTTLNNLGVIFALEKDWERAGALYRRALAVNPHYARASENLNRVTALITR